MTQVKAKLKIVLQADETVVAEADDPVLWQKVLAAINGGALTSATNPGLGNPTAQVQFEGDSRDQEELPPPEDHVGRFAHQLGLDVAVVEGACSPSSVAPYLHLDAHCWEEMKDQAPARGRGAISPIAVAATLLGLWFRASGLGNPTQVQARAVLGTIGVNDKNPSRGLQTAAWLQTRPSGAIQVNPAQISTAVRVARSFCTKEWSTPGQ